MLIQQVSPDTRLATALTPRTRSNWRKYPRIENRVPCEATASLLGLPRLGIHPNPAKTRALLGRYNSPNLCASSDTFMRFNPLTLWYIVMGLFNVWPIKRASSSRSNDEHPRSQSRSASPTNETPSDRRQRVQRNNYYSQSQEDAKQQAEKVRVTPTCVHSIVTNRRLRKEDGCSLSTNDRPRT